MRIKSNLYYDTMTKEVAKRQLERIEEYKEYDNATPTADLIDKLKSFERKIHLSLWHDGSTVSNHSHILMMVSCIYDKAIYFTDTEYKEEHGKCRIHHSEYIKTKYKHIYTIKINTRSILYVIILYGYFVLTL